MSCATSVRICPDLDSAIGNIRRYLVVVLKSRRLVYRIYRISCRNKHVWFELYKSCYSQLGGECHISRIRPFLDGIKAALSIYRLENFEFGGWGGG